MRLCDTSMFGVLIIKPVSNIVKKNSIEIIIADIFSLLFIIII